MPIFNRLFYNRHRREAMSAVAGRLLMVGMIMAGLFRLLEKLRCHRQYAYQQQ